MKGKITLTQVGEDAPTSVNVSLTGLSDGPYAWEVRANAVKAHDCNVSVGERTEVADKPWDGSGNSLARRTPFSATRTCPWPAKSTSSEARS